MTGIALALGAALGWGVADFLGGAVSRRAEALVVLGISQAVGVVIVIVAVLVTGLGEPVGLDLLYAAGSGVFLTLGLGALYRAMAVGAMAIASPIAATGTLIPVGVGLASGDRPSALQGIGASAAVLGVVLCSREPAAAGRPKAGRIGHAVGLALLAAIGGGLTATALAGASSAGVLWVLLLQRGTVAVLALGIASRGRGRPRISRSALPAIAAIGVMDLAATALFTVGATHGALSLVAVVGAMYPVVTVALAYVVLSERLAPLQAVGVVAALGGVAAIAAG